MSGAKMFIAIFLLLQALPLNALALEPKDKCRIGVILPLSGPAAYMGEGIKNGIQLAYSTLDPLRQKNLELIFEDDALQPRNTISAFNKLQSLNQVDVVISLASGNSNAIAPLAEKYQVPLIAIASDPQITKGKQFAFTLWVTPEEEAGVLVPEAIKRGYKRIARITATQDGMLAIKDAFERQNQGLIDTVLDQEYPLDARDFKPFINQLKQIKDVDAVLVLLYFSQSGAFARQLRELGVKLPLFAVESFEDPNEVKTSQGALLNQWYVVADDAQESFTKAYQAKFPNAAITGAANGHDALLLISQAAQQAKSRSEIRDFLATLKDFEGALGKYSATGDNRFTLPATVKVVTTKGFEKIK